MLIPDRLAPKTAGPTLSPRWLPRPIWFVPATIALIVTVIGLRFGLPLYRQAVAIRMIEDCGGFVEVRPAGLAFPVRWFGDGWAKYFGEVVTVRTQWTHGWDGADIDLRALRGLPHLEHLNLLLADIPDADLRHIASLTHLKELDLSYTEIGDAGLEHLEGLTQLESLNLMRTRITDAGLRHLYAMTHLKDLWISETAVTDAGIDELKGLTALEMVIAHRTQVTDEAVEKIKRSLPDVELYRSLPRD